MIITIDGPAGSGKSTIARRVAQELHFLFLDTGALYRTASYGLIMHGIAPQDEAAVSRFIQNNPVSIIYDQGAVSYWITQQDVSLHLRSQHVGAIASLIATYAAVRAALLPIQQQFAHYNIVCEGRDMGTVVFPQAEIKIFLTANIEARVERRCKELNRTDSDVVQQEILDRDTRDQSRKCAPLRPPENCVEIDTSNLSIEQVSSRILQEVVRYSQSM